MNMYTRNQLDEFSRDQLYLLLNRSKRENHCLNTELVKCELLLKKYQKYFDNFNHIIGFKKELYGLVKEIELLNKINEKKSRVTLEELTRTDNDDNYKYNDNICHEYDLDYQDSTFDKNIDYNNESINNSFKQLECIVNSVESKFPGEVIYSADMGFQSTDKSKIEKKKSRLTLEDNLSKDKDIFDDIIPLDSPVSVPKSKTSVELLRNFRPIDRKNTEHSTQTCVRRKNPEWEQSDSSGGESHRNTLVAKKDSLEVYDYIDKEELDIIDRVKLKSRRKKLFCCDWKDCTKSYAFQSGLDRHRRTHVPIPCEWPECGQMFPNKRLLNDHMRDHRLTNRQKTKTLDESDNYFVDYYHNIEVQPINHEPITRYSTTAAIAEELELSEQTAWLLCPEPDCQFKTMSTETLNSHMKTHINLNECEICGRCFSSRAQTNKHIQVEHQTPRLDIRCEWYGCDRLFATKQEMSDHLTASHQYFDQYRPPPEEVFTCTFHNCGQNFNSEPLFKEHLRGHALRLVPCIWPECDFKTHNTDLIRQHMESHLKR